MGLALGDIEGVALAGTIHDMGKMYVPVELLVKPARLTKSECTLVQGHAQAGYEILRGIEFPAHRRDRLSAPRANERRRLPPETQGDKISLATRIIAIADVVDAMSSPHPYRTSLGIEKAIREISSRRGDLYDPEAVEICLSIL